ncbi:zinc finger MYND domain-containing protein 15 [Marchantia polymorpha subsp. ruderalis]|uniref:MYND-type domain-containing protein n=1 Tax=Marchantia polymorpha TaxID=3197 RepID=A0A2R6XDI5_MARPO|nr:hypothetical protein MARPO_0021s0002 [Marchantia polymorpha]BBN01197.1 hypothetical protein Mp_2g05460 [Marchantia polymorpha subsp. ruderalis]|eukprot:PTQ44119.1 hypothetical protein MARPO_0021s0002 [Marchantia polymorpha]
MDVHLKEIFGSFSDQFGVGRGSDLLKVKGITTPLLECVFRTIAELWRSAPWRRLNSSDLLGVKIGKASDWSPLERQPFKCARFLGAGSKDLGVDLLRSEQDAVGPTGKPTKAIPVNGLLRITFGGETDLFPTARRMIRSLGLEIAGPSAFPAVEVILPTKSKSLVDRKYSSYRTPHVLELKWLIACLKALTQVHPQLQKIGKFGGSNKFDDLLQNVEISLPSPGEENSVPDDGPSITVRVTYPPKVTFDFIPKLDETDDRDSCSALLLSRQCVSCMKELPADGAPRCGSCKAVYYCGMACQKKDWKEIHKDECAQYEKMMERAAELEIKELSFPVLDSERSCRWLDQMGLHGKGMWRRICKCYHSCPFGHLPLESLVGGWAHTAAWGLEHGSYPPDAPLKIQERQISSSQGSSNSSGTHSGANSSEGKSGGRPAAASAAEGGGAGSGSKMNCKLEGSPVSSVSNGGRSNGTMSSEGSSGTRCNTYGSERSTGSDGSSLSSWVDYYHLRSLTFFSPVAAILTYPLTVYNIVTSICASSKTILAKHKEVTIHYLGPQGELDWLPAFAEVGHLLSAFHSGSLHIVMVGPEVPNSLSGEATGLGKKLRITYVQGLYQEEATALFPPNLVVALNAGLDRSGTWAGDLNIIKQQAVPTYFTDYAESCCLNAKQVLLAAELPLTQPIVPNAFRSPVRAHVPFTDVPWFTNGFLFGVNT